ncbi:tlde1 domain-containing protein [Rhizobium leucaenae]|uniref:F0F1-type ATP synthase membrane subunit c/vacuolar-type H+-ATPase subunit K n=1 Tax=Rhizobium leucaenae TaxID=29450 RepID=A0A7W7ELY7_9HYPH|nr:tlde1 domain-containing protein [Rhizobium leucaenae]MBB4570481.1 F0F1-type ATP synthase membrane subunit c/vacuolar-type H+-ATPase subunit K [Rhizobium leucaenae]MBB6303383.1 F0F1-type ATP synthase membrane subunit c/vacuolar-type H+-ATPase subunit K [Rhizobium leucaenae]
MAFATETFGNFNSRSGYASRRKKSPGISQGTVVTGVAVAVFAWVAATLITTQSMVLSLPGADTALQDSLTPRASAFIVPQGHIAHAARLASQTVPMGGRARVSALSADAEKLEAIARSKAILARGLVKQQLANALSQQASDLARAQAASVIAKNDTSISPATVAHLRDVAAVALANAGKSLMQSNILGAAISITAAAGSMPRSTEVAMNKPAIRAAAPNSAALDHPGKDSLPIAASASDALPTEMASAAPSAGTIDRAVAESLATTASSDAAPEPFDIVPMARPDQTPTTDNNASSDAGTVDLADAEDPSAVEELPSVVPLPRPAHVVARATASGSTSDAADEADTSPTRALAYANPDEEVKRSRPFLNPFAALRPRGGTAIYDISAGTVYLPSGERLEAHSGLGHMRDNPRYVDRKNTGPTPPETYDLTYRESLFHGVQALRLTPANGARVYGRVGLLAHTYMLRGARGDSNGCVVFKDYSRFLAAFKRGEIKRLQVVTRLSSAPSNVASR